MSNHIKKIKYLVVLILAIAIPFIVFAETSISEDTTMSTLEETDKHNINNVEDATDAENNIPDTDSNGNGRKYDSLVRHYADKFNVSYSLMNDILDCENDTRNPNRQSEVRYTESQIKNNPSWGAVGEFEKSFGLVMIHIPACNKYEGKCITESQAKDPEFAIRYLASEISKGKASKWSCYSG